MDAKARELLGFIGVVLALLAATASQSGPVAGVGGAVFYAAAILAAALLVWAGVRSVAQITEPSSFRDIGATVIGDYRDDPAVPDREPEELRAQAFYHLVDDAQINSQLLENTHDRLSAAYGTFATALGAAGIAVIALVGSLV